MQQLERTSGQDGNIAAHPFLLGAAVIWREVLLLRKIILLFDFDYYREVAEWSKAHDWNSCMGQLIEGSNPFLSAILIEIFKHLFYEIL